MEYEETMENYPGCYEDAMEWIAVFPGLSFHFQTFNKAYCG
jgi:hypothetical protein